MFLSWLKRKRRRKLLAVPFPEAWLAVIERNVAHYRYLTAAQQAKLRDDVRLFIAEKNWEGCGGLELTDEMRVTIAAQACLMCLEIPGDPLARIISILVYPTGYVVPQERFEQSFSIQGEEHLLGQAVYRGPVILSWEDVLYDSLHPGSGQNLVWHEFAHQIDMLDRSVNGTPPLADPAQRHRWHDVMTGEYERLIEAARAGRATLLDVYGATDEGEFFAVATECFFDRPHELAGQHADLYALLREYYRQDPATRMPAAGG